MIRRGRTSTGGNTEKESPTPQHAASEIRVVHKRTGTRGTIVGPGEVFVAWRNGSGITDLVPLADLADLSAVRSRFEGDGGQS